MQATLEFDLPEEKNDLLLSLKAVELSIVIERLLQYIRAEIKYKDDVNQSRHETLEDVRKNLLDLIDEYGVSDVIN
jgi:hypothetical protein